MRSAFACEPNPPVERLRIETEAAFRRADTIRTIDRVTVASAGSVIAHGFNGVPRWRVFNQEGAGDVYQTQPADRQFLYLEATPADVVVSLELF
jgi:hypothetical protein